MRLLLRGILRWRVGRQEHHRDALLTVLEKYVGLATPDLIAKWRGQLAEVEAKLEDCRGRLAQADLSVQLARLRKAEQRAHRP